MRVGTLTGGCDCVPCQKSRAEKSASVWHVQSRNAEGNVMSIIEGGRWFTTELQAQSFKDEVIYAYKAYRAKALAELASLVRKNPTTCDWREIDAKVAQLHRSKRSFEVLEAEA